jgi:hypothetical protein
MGNGWMSDIAQGKDTGGVFGGLSSPNWLTGGDATKGMQTSPATADWQRRYLMTSAEQAAPTVAPVGSGAADQMRGQQGQLASMLFNQAQGLTPGAGELAVQRQAGNAMAQQTAQAQMARGAGAALAGRNAARANADIGVNAAGQAGIAQMQDQQGAQNQLGGLLGGMRGQDLGQRGQDIGVAQGNQQAQLAQQQQNIAALAQMLGVDVAALQQDLAKRGIDAQDKGMMGTLVQTGGQIGASYVSRPKAPGQ